jgi:hypothetical protein
MKLLKIYELVHAAPEGELTLQQIVGPLRKAFKPYPWIRFEVRHQPVNGLGPNCDRDTLWSTCVSGRFEPDYCGRSVCFVTISDYALLKGRTINFTGDRRKRILFEIFTTLAHERIHLLQSRKAQACPRPYRAPEAPAWLRPSVEYYGESNEIEAFAYTAALEEWCGVVSESVSRYRVLFGSSHPLYKKFLKKKVKFSLTMPEVCVINSLSHGGDYGRRICGETRARVC